MESDLRVEQKRSRLGQRSGITPEAGGGRG
jgi:hypothetical protein